MTAPANLISSEPTGRHHAGGRSRTGPPAALAVDLGSSTVNVWATHRGTVSSPCADAFSPLSTIVRRGRVVDPDACVSVLSQMIRRYSEPVPAGSVVVACRPVLASESDQEVVRRVLDTVFAPARLLFIDTVRAAAIGAGAAAGTLLIADLGAELTEVALLKDARVVAARRADLGTRDLGGGASVELLSEIVGRHVEDLRRAAGASELAAAKTRGMLLVGDGALHPGLSLALSTALRLHVHRAAAPRTAAINGAGLAAMSLLSHPSRRPQPSRLDTKTPGGHS